ncbi:DUF4870 domain-containing protein [Oleiharenicola lentus]|uniref:DUF4870 domain-containing protein n=1 Tax=Oleiharenicola lentus TaxID=2508720 RepID=UPI003F680E3F
MSTTIDIDPAPPLSSEDRTVAILSYITLIGFIVAIVIHGNKKTALGAFHLRQTLGLVISAIVIGVGGWVLALIPILGWLAILAIWICWLIIWVTGLIAAINGKLTPAPIMGAQFQKWFANTF